MLSRRLTPSILNTEAPGEQRPQKETAQHRADGMWPICTSARDFSVSVNFPK
jgi:hypothetical protein